MAQNQPDEIDPVVLARSALETLIFAPIGLGAKLVDDAPAAARRVRQELDNARFIGRLTVEQGAARLRAPATESDRRARSIRAEVVDAGGDGDEGDALPIAGYDELPAVEIVAMLSGLTSAQRDVVRDHETANRRRRTVLGKIAQLA